MPYNPTIADPYDAADTCSKCSELYWNEECERCEHFDALASDLRDEIPGLRLERDLGRYFYVIDGEARNGVDEWQAGREIRALLAVEGVLDAYDLDLSEVGL